MKHSAPLCNESVRTGGGHPKGANHRRGGPHRGPRRDTQTRRLSSATATRSISTLRAGWHRNLGKSVACLRARFARTLPNNFKTCFERAKHTRWPRWSAGSRGKGLPPCVQQPQHLVWRAGGHVPRDNTVYLRLSRFMHQCIVHSRLPFGVA